MKLTKWMFGVLATALFAACSDDREIAPTPPDEVVGSEGYISITIGMPTQPSTRATLTDNDIDGSNNDQFDDGLKREYDVDKAAIIFFIGDNEENATFYKAYNILNEFTEDKDNDQVTQYRAATFPVNFATEANKSLWALAILNFGEVIKLSENKSDTDKAIGATVSIKKEGSDAFVDIDGSYTIKEFMQLTTDIKLYKGESGKETYFFMTNTPYSRVPGGTNEPQFQEGSSSYFRVLADVDRAKICETKEEAAANPAAEIFVERAVAKVQVLANPTKLSETLANGIKISEINWLIDNTEPKGYLVRNLESVEAGYVITNPPTWATYMNSKSGDYRFIGSVPFRKQPKYRTYFCSDPNGDGISLEEDPSKQIHLTRINDNGVTPSYKPISSPQYCKENTFSVANMNYLNTTRAVIEVIFEDKDGNTPTFYTIGLDNKHQFTYENAARHLAVEVITCDYLRNAWDAYFKSLGKEYHNNASTLNLEYSTGDASSLTAKNEWMELTFSNKNARLTLSNIELLDGEGNKINGSTQFLTEDSKKAAINEINASMVIKAYSNGKSYYAVRIKHFGDDLTPWSTEAENTPTTEEAYGNENNAGVKEKYLGRYGVVRNNWYQLQITAINNFGEPTYADLPLDGTPDDKVVKEESISCKVNILAWALRRQEVEL